MNSIDIQNRISDLVSSSVKSSFPVDLNNYDIHPNNEKIILITQYHECENEERDLEIVDSINRNIDNQYIDKVLLFTENLSENDIKNKINLTEKVEVLESKRRIAFHLLFNYLFSEPAYHGDNSNIFLLTNSDCYFDESLSTLKYVNFEDRPSPLFLTMTRYEDFSGSLDIGKNPFVEKWENFEYNGGKNFSIKEYEELPYLEPWSSDAWAFKFNALDWIHDNFHKFNNELGTSMCELLLVHDLLKLGIDCKNIGLSGYIKCIHQHKSLYREEKNISKKIEDYIPGIVPDESKGIFRTQENVIKGNFRLISGENWIDNPEREHS